MIWEGVALVGVVLVYAIGFDFACFAIARIAKANPREFAVRFLASGWPLILLLFLGVAVARVVQKVMRDDGSFKA